MNIPIYECQGWAADDVIGTVGKICSNNGWECVIVTGDRDSLQLIDENVRVKLVISKPGATGPMPAATFTPPVWCCMRCWRDGCPLWVIPLYPLPSSTSAPFPWLPWRSTRTSRSSWN